MKKVSLALLACLLVALNSGGVSSASSPKSGSTCSSSSKRIISGDYIYTCTKSGKNFVWSKGVKIVSSSPSTIPTPASQPSPSLSSPDEAALNGYILCLNQNGFLGIKTLQDVWSLDLSSPANNKAISCNAFRPQIANPPPKISIPVGEVSTNPNLILETIGDGTTLDKQTTIGCAFKSLQGLGNVQATFGLAGIPNSPSIVDLPIQQSYMTNLKAFEFPWDPNSTNGYQNQYATCIFTSNGNYLGVSSAPIPLLPPIVKEVQDTLLNPQVVNQQTFHWIYPGDHYSCTPNIVGKVDSETFMWTLLSYWIKGNGNPTITFPANPDGTLTITPSVYSQIELVASRTFSNYLDMGTDMIICKVTATNAAGSNTK